MPSPRTLGVAVAALVASTAPSAAAADPAFRYTTPAEPAYARAAVEEVIILGLGYLQYTTNKGNQADWDLSYDWASMRSKLVFDAVTFDNNKYDTNWLTHPGAGFLYYSAGRANRLSIVESFALAVASSALWEYVGEWREHASINDMINTPMTAAPLGETVLQLGALMHRSRRSPATVALGWLFAPLKSAHDAIDGLEPERAAAVDDLGLADDVWHRLTIGASAGVTHQRGGTTQGDGRFRASSRIVSLDGYGRAGHRSGWFDAAEVSDLAFTAAASDGRLVDVNLAASMVAGGFRAQSVATDRSGRLRGRETIAGLEVGAEYGIHDYDRDRRRDEDRVALVAGGAAVEHVIHAGGVRARTSFHVLATFAGVTPYALGRYERDFGGLRLPSVVRNQRYAHAWGGTLRPEVELTWDRLDAGADLRADWFSSVTDLDVEFPPTNPERPAQDRRLWTRAWLGFSPSRHVRVSLSAERRARAGNLPGARASRWEAGGYFGVDAVF